MKEIITLNPKLFYSIATFLIGFLADYIFQKFGIIFPDEVKTLFILVVTTLIARYSRIFFKNEMQKNDFQIFIENKKLSD